MKPIEKKVAIHQQAIEVSDPEPRRLEPLHEKVKRERSIIVELDTPRHLEIDAFVEGAKTLYHEGADIVMMADNSLASPRMSNIAMGSILKLQHEIRVMPHFTCRDRNLIGLQSHLMGLECIRPS